MTSCDATNVGGIESQAFEGRFALKDASSRYSQQFSQIYFCRLKALLPSLHSAAGRRWGERAADQFVGRILEMLPKRQSIIFGILFAELPDKPNVLNDLNGEVCIGSAVRLIL